MFFRSKVTSFSNICSTIESETVKAFAIEIEEAERSLRCRLEELEKEAKAISDLCEKTQEMLADSQIFAEE